MYHIPEKFEAKPKPFKPIIVQHTHTHLSNVLICGQDFFNNHSFEIVETFIKTDAL